MPRRTLGSRQTPDSSVRVPSGRSESLKLRVWARMCSRRASADVLSSGSQTAVIDTWLPSPPCSCARRTSTGIIAFSGVGVRPRSSASVRSAPDTTARPTSLRVPAWLRETARRSLSAALYPTSVRRGPSVPFSADSGASGRRSCTSTLATRLASRSALRAVVRGWVTARAASTTARVVSSAPCRIGSSARCAVLGAGSACQCSGAGGGSSPVSSSSAATCRAAAPSAIAWCTRPTKPSRPSDRRGASASCHSGRLRSSGTDSSASRSSAKRSRLISSSGSLSSTTCRRRSNRASSTQRGSVSPSGASSRRWRQRGIKVRRPAIRSRIASIVGRGPFSAGERIALQPTCICAQGDSSCRNEASIGDKRWQSELITVVTSL
jgi:hypothetical protein